MQQKKDTIQLSDHFTYRRLLRFALPSIAMMVFTSIYGVVDGYFISNFVGKIPFAAINLIIPAVMIQGGFGFMVGTGGSALVGRVLGEGDPEKARKYFSMLVEFVILGGTALSILGIVFLRPIALLLGATEALLPDCLLYGRILMGFNVTFMLQTMFQTFLVTAEKPKLGLYVTLWSGITNMVLDAVFVGWFRWGVAGAAYATGLSQSVGAFVPLVYFLRPNSSLLKITLTPMKWKPLLQSMSNGISELMSSVSSSVVGMMFNMQLLRLAGENGLAAYGVIMYVSFAFVAVFIGYTMSTAPIVSFHYGAQNHGEMQSVLKKSGVLMGLCGAAMTVLGWLLAKPFSEIFVGYDRELWEMTVRAFQIFSCSYILAGLNIFASSFFTALNNGLVSAVISFLRSLVFQLIAVVLLPIVLGLDGIWWAVTVADLAAFCISMAFLFGLKNRYHYM